VLISVVLRPAQFVPPGQTAYTVPPLSSSAASQPFVPLSVPKKLTPLIAAPGGAMTRQPPSVPWLEVKLPKVLRANRNVLHPSA
jgi:hypothetical protein